jgi:putative toxin-antitoxin system antitoxin component (TIGR02293 family)
MIKSHSKSTKSRRRTTPRATPATAMYRRQTPELVKSIQKGFPFGEFARFEQESGLPREVIARLISIPDRTLSRRQSEGRLKSDESDRLARLARIFDLALKLFHGGRDQAVHWLQSPAFGLDGAVPLEYAGTDAGAREVENLVGRLLYGDYT